MKAARSRSDLVGLVRDSAEPERVETRIAADRGAIRRARLLTTTEVADMLSISPKSVYRYAAEGRLPYIKIESNLRFERQEILDWLEAKRFRPGLRKRPPR